MINFLIRRILLMIPMILGITALTYLVICLTPGGPAAGLVADLNPRVSQEFRQRQIEEFKFDKPFYVQYAFWISKVARLNFGNTLKDNQPVVRKLAERIPKTLMLTGLSMILVYLLAIPIGVLSALRQNSWIDRFLSGAVFVGFSIPTFWVALLLMIFFGIYLGWFPLAGYESILTDEMPFWARVVDVAKHLTLPLVVTMITGLAALSRYTRNGMLDVIRQDYIRTARAKGLPERTVIIKHALRNTLIPLVTILGLSIPDLFSGAIIFETIFSYPGLGRLTYEAYMTRDINLIMASVTMGAFLTLLGNLVADVAYAYADPRIRYG